MCTRSRAHEFPVRGVFPATSSDSAAEQYSLFPHPSTTFEIMTFDQVLRGSYNTTACVKEYMNCMEVIKADLICLDGRLQNSVCAHIRDTCTQYAGQNFDRELHIFESVCETPDAT
ncbi:uncharacterized protein LOC116412820 isoform X2 [Galleria mellonella]|uniref:Uncharacterized protein LOC116412820 isoform X2 n=1 Tax=Galleria mellonella TaxID=7137 RepID=A0ABM3MNB1_GALME|nr:uncharacterized protein LOC116412820 isoform X2 [Galleria mellonella]